MAEPLKNSFGPDVPVVIADMITSVYPEFDRDRFIALAVAGLEDLELSRVPGTSLMLSPRRFPRTAGTPWRSSPTPSDRKPSLPI